MSITSDAYLGSVLHESRSDQCHREPPIEFLVGTKAGINKGCLYTVTPRLGDVDKEAGLSLMRKNHVYRSDF